MSNAFLALFACFWMTLVGAFDVFAVRGIWQQFQSGHYPFVMGQVTYSEVTSHRSSKGHMSYGVDIRYHYVVDDHPYDGTRYRYGSTASGHNWAYQTVRSHPVGSQISVYFNPANPQDALIAPDVQGVDLFMLVFLMPFNVIGVGFWTAIGGWLRRKISNPVAGGVLILVDGPKTSIRLPQYTALMWFMVAIGALSFISVFVIGFATEFDPSVAVAGLMLLLTVGSGVAVYIWQWDKIHSGEDDLVLDETSQTILLPKTYGRKEHMAASRGEIQKLTVERVVHHGKNGSVSYTYAPMLWLGRDVGHGEKLADWMDQKRAEAFAEWLRQKLSLSSEVIVEQK